VSSISNPGWLPTLSQASGLRLPGIIDDCSLRGKDRLKNCRCTSTRQQKMEVQKTYINEDNTVTIRCSQCGRKKVFNISRNKEISKPVPVKCSCGSKFAVRLEWRKFYRKPVALHGEYSKDGCELEVGAISVEKICYGGMILENVCLGGIGFRTNSRHNLQVGDVIQVAFNLDDGQKSLVTRNVIVRSIQDSTIGTEFCDNKADKALAFYLMP
jgi:hypothetical protein